MMHLNSILCLLPNFNFRNFFCNIEWFGIKPDFIINIWFFLVNQLFWCNFFLFLDLRLFWTATYTTKFLEVYKKYTIFHLLTYFFCTIFLKFFKQVGLIHENYKRCTKNTQYH